MRTTHLLVINSGSSSIKFAVYEFNASLKKLLNGSVENIKSAPTLKMFDAKGALLNQKTFNKNLDYDDYFELLISALESNKFGYSVCAIGHRVVHGGESYRLPIKIDKKVIQALKTLIPFAPLHQPYNIQAIESIAKALPKLPQVACFDTAFHRTHPTVADRFGLPRTLFDMGVRRYGFHGLSYEYVMHKLNDIDKTKAKKRIIVAHLGNGASMCAIHHGKSIDSSMGLTAVDGLVMGTRCGSLDPGVILFLQNQQKMSVSEIENMLYKQSGLLGVSGISHDMKILLEDSHIQAQEAIELFIYRIRRELGALVATLGGLDLLIFTGGIGEHAWQIRQGVCKHMDWLGLHMDPRLNKKNQPIINTPQSEVEVRIMPTNEEWIIAHHTYQLLSPKDTHHGK